MCLHLRVASLCAGLMAAASALAEPRSAIPWLSDALAAPEREASAPGPRPGPRPIEVSALGAARPLGPGLLAMADSGLPAGLWGRTSALRIRALVARLRGTGVPAAQEVLRTLMLARLTEPRGIGPEAGPALLHARADMLLRLGAVEEARELLELSRDASPGSLARVFDIGLLTGEQTRACRTLLAGPGVEPTAMARIFCLARLDDWRGAVLSLAVARETGDLTVPETDLLARFLETVETNPGDEIALSGPLTPLTHVMLLGIGAGAGTLADHALPAAFLHHDLAQDAPPRARMLAAEALVAAGGLGYPVLFAAYRAATPAASGGVWSRSDAVQDLDRAIELGDPVRVAEALDAADEALAPLGLRVALAREYAPALATLPRHPALAESPLAELLVLGGETATARAVVTPRDPMTLQAALAAAAGMPFPAGGARIAAIAMAFADTTTESPRLAALTALIADDRAGEALLGALALLDAGPAIDPADLAAALSVLRRLGQEQAARRIAVETLLFERRG
jgi:hypothetical protein